MRRLTKVIVTVLCLALRAHAGTYVVNSTADSGAGSLRAAIEAANSFACSDPCLITFDFGSPKLTTITPESQLPPITASNVTIAPGPFPAGTVELDGSRTGGNGLKLQNATGCSIRGLIINGCPAQGIVIEGGFGNAILFNVIGLDRTGTTPVPNGQNGIVVLGGNGNAINDNTIGGNHGHGILARDTVDLSLFGNNVGVSAAGGANAALGNGACGVYLENVLRAVILGNVIANNALCGVAVAGNSLGVRVMPIFSGLPVPGFIYSNGGLGIDLGFDGPTPNHSGQVSGPNHFQNAPVISIAESNNGFLHVAGDINTVPNSRVFVDLFGNRSVGPNGGQGEYPFTFLAPMTDASGAAHFDTRFALPPSAPSQWITATATTEDGTSEFSTPKPVSLADLIFRVTTTSDSGEGSLRQAIANANVGPCASTFPCRIVFDIPPPPPPGGAYSIVPRTPLPPIVKSGISIDGATQPTAPGTDAPLRIEISGRSCGACDGIQMRAVDETLDGVAVRNLVINGFRGAGVRIRTDASRSVTSPVIAGNYIGTNASGTAAVPNDVGIAVTADVPFLHSGTFDTSNRIDNDVVSGNLTNGIQLDNGFFGMVGDRIGTDSAGREPIPNGAAGLWIGANAVGAQVGRNTIAYNRGAGVVNIKPGGFKAIINNSILGNGSLGIDLFGDGIPSDISGEAPIPVITSAEYDPVTKRTQIRGTVGSGSDGIGRVINLYKNRFPDFAGRGEGEVSISFGLPTYAVNGEFNIYVDDVRGYWISATATPLSISGFKGTPGVSPELFGQGFMYGTTSEFSEAVPVRVAGCPTDVARITMPAAGETVRSPVPISWTNVAGAIGYAVWISPVPGAPKESSATPTLAPGTYEIFIETRFPNCPSTMTKPLRITVPAPRRRVG